MSTINESRHELESIETPSVDIKERLGKPSILRSLHKRFDQDDEKTSANRAAVQELMEFVPPYDQADLDQRGMGDRFNVNFGLAASLKNEAVGAYLDLYTSPTSLSKIKLESSVDPEMRDTWAAVMDEEFTKMFRSWDGAMQNMLLLAETFVTHGIAIPWFEDPSSILFEVSGLEDAKFPADAVSIPSKNEIVTFPRNMSASDLFAKIEDKELSEDMDGWNGHVVKWLIENSRSRAVTDSPTNFEAIAREIKACRFACSTTAPSVPLVWGFVRELDGNISVYATTRDLIGDKPSAGEMNEDDIQEKWLFRKRNAYPDVNQAYQIFPFSVGNKNRIYTIRGLGYALYEAGQADNVLRCKMMDAARHRSSEIYQPESAIDSTEDIQFIDVGHAMIAPKGLRVVQNMNSMRLDQSVGYALDSNIQIMDRHSAGLARNSITDNPSARRNEMQVTFEMEHLNKMQGFAISLFYGPYDKLMREIIRRAFQETQSDLMASKMVESMREACIARGVPADVFDKIDLAATQATRLMGAGSKSSRIIAYQQMAQLFSSMDDQGQENFNYDYASELMSAEKADRYFGRPGQRRGHVDIAIARLENTQLLEGDIMDPVDGENRMVHLQEHLMPLIESVDEVNQGAVDIADWVLRYIPLYRHTIDTLELTSVHPSRIPELNSIRQQIQQVGELIDNGLRHLNKLREQEGEAGVQMDEAGNPIPADPSAPGAMTPEQTAAQRDNEMKLNRIFAEGQAKLSIMAQTSKAKIDIMKGESAAKIGMQDAETAAAIRRKEAMARAGAN